MDDAAEIRHDCRPAVPHPCPTSPALLLDTADPPKTVHPRRSKRPFDEIARTDGRNAPGVILARLVYATGSALRAYGLLQAM